MAAYTTIELARIAPHPGDGKRLELELEPGAGHARRPRATRSSPPRCRRGSTSRGPRPATRCGSRSTGELAGPCMRCLADARVAVEVEAREVDQPRTDDEELRSPYVDEGELDLSAWAHDALALALPAAAALPPRLRRALPGLRRVAQRRAGPAPTITRASPTRAGRSCAS